MTNNEAISRIKFLLDVGGSDGFTSADIEALNMAINAFTEEISEKPKSNGDRIRAMTDEELARVLVFRDCANDLVVCPKMNQGNSCIHSCTDTFLEWLKQEVKDDDKV